MQAPKAARQIAQKALLPGAVLGWQACAAHVSRGVCRRVAAGVAQRLVWMRTLSITVANRDEGEVRASNTTEFPTNQRNSTEVRLSKHICLNFLSEIINLMGGFSSPLRLSFSIK